jgi:hypothetical protein
MSNPVKVAFDKNHSTGVSINGLQNISNIQSPVESFENESQEFIKQSSNDELIRIFGVAVLV